MKKVSRNVKANNISVQTSELIAAVRYKDRVLRV